MFQFIKRLFGFIKPKSPYTAQIKREFAKYKPYNIEEDIYIPGIGCFTVNDSNREEFNKWFSEYLVNKGWKINDTADRHGDKKEPNGN